MAKKKNMKPWIILGAISVFIIIIISSIVGTYNGLVTLDESVNGQWANVESSYQRRMDLIPNLVATVQGAADFEQETFTEITKARSAWTNAGNPGDKIAAANSMESALSRLLVTVENYPDLKATLAFRDLQVQLEGTENRINVERSRYNEAIKNYNTKRRKFPNMILAGMFGFENRNPFEAQVGAETAPTVDFN